MHVPPGARAVRHARHLRGRMAANGRTSDWARLLAADQAPSKTQGAAHRHYRSSDDSDEPQLVAACGPGVAQVFDFTSALAFGRIVDAHGPAMLAAVGGPSGVLEGNVSRGCWPISAMPWRCLPVLKRVEQVSDVIRPASLQCHG